MKKYFYNILSLVILAGSLGIMSCESEHLIEGKPVLSVSSDIFVADGNAEILLTVMVGDKDVTADAKIYVDNTPLETSRFATTVAKDYKFFASYNGQISNQITVTAANPVLYVELPADSQADKFEAFAHKVLLTQCTGTWCGYCPYMIRSIELFQENGSNAANTVVVATHSGDDLSSSASEAAVSALKASSFPSVYFSLNPDLLIGNADPNVNSEVINTTAGMELKDTARVGIAAVTAAVADSSVVSVRAAVKVGKPGVYRVNAWLVEDGVPAYQYSQWGDFASGIITHDHVLRAASCISPIQGVLLGGKDSLEQGEVAELYHEFNVADAGVSSVANCKVVVLVSASNGSKFYVNNVMECPVGASVPFAYND